MKQVQEFELSSWTPHLSADEKQKLMHALEDGIVLYFPSLSFDISEEEKALFSSNLVEKGRKNISYNLLNHQLKGCAGTLENQKVIEQMMHRFALTSQNFVMDILDSYKDSLEIGRTSFRPVEIKGRQCRSIKKDDTLLHIDSFPSSPTQGKRILRFFANVNPFEIPRVWKVGESYKKVIKRFLPQIKSPLLGYRTFLKRFGITKSYRILYDHYMLHIHDMMKADRHYQEHVEQEIVSFAPFTCWMTFTDQVSHAVLSGQYAFEQSFYLPVDAQLVPDKSPLVYMEKIMQKNLRD